ncbi:hypothetical protein [Dyadobacter sp. CY323]|uniref:hypothetical protein n=1 Tax=Dyadobacter sp. CY323 TaxID=2907302 RepID=UPI001F2CAECD|nr:hypothetical protein [Dyadobacter sp. CY323]MCE6991160.1 hypothetical protein [Dyadobacter sp. CY323]
MFKIQYKIQSEQFNDVRNITEDEIHYDFLLGSLSLLASDAEIDMEWDWIPLLDFAYCMKEIVFALKKYDVAFEIFEFTENSEILKFSLHNDQLKVSASFSSIFIDTSLTDFESAVMDFHLSISNYIRTNVIELPKVLSKYLFVER